MVIFVAPVSHCVELALFAVDFSGKFPKYVAAVPHLHSIHPSKGIFPFRSVWWTVCGKQKQIPYRSM